MDPNRRTFKRVSCIIINAPAAAYISWLWAVRAAYLTAVYCHTVFEILRVFWNMHRNVVNIFGAYEDQDNG
jgi:hypothetical protein